MTAYHEAGHVVALLLLGFPVGAVSILEDVTEETGRSSGHTDHGTKPSPWLDRILAAATITPEMRKAEQRWRRRRVRDYAIACAAGFWAEYELGVPPKLSWIGARHDRKAVRRLRSDLDDMDDPLPRRVTAGMIHARAWRLIHGHWLDVKRVAQALLAHDTLTGEALVDLLPGLVSATRFNDDGHPVVVAIRSNLEELTPREKRRNLTPTPEARAQAEEAIPEPATY